MDSHKMVEETNTSVFEYHHEWKLNNFLKYHDVLRGSEFSPLRFIPLRFAFELEPRVKGTDGHVYYKLNLIKLSQDEVSKSCKFEILIKIYNGPTYGTSIIPLSTVGSPISICNMTESTCLFTAELLPNKHLYVNSTNIFAALEMTFQTHFTFFGYNVTTVSTTDPSVRSPYERYANICSGLKTLHESKTDSDMSFKIGDKTLEAHRCILRAQSPVFKRMFENNLAESKTNCIEITDCDVHVFDCFLRYIYCGDIDDTSFDVVRVLFELGDKYGVPGLVKDCGEILAANLTVDTACKIAVLSYLHSDTILMKKSMQFINHYFSLIREKTEWAKLMDDYPTLASEVFGFMPANF